MGIIVNRPVNICLGDMLDQLDISVIRTDTRKIPIYLGGPVQTDRGFVLHSGDKTWDSTLKITPEINITTSRDILEAIAKGKGPTYSLIALGYAGWISGQIEQEIGANTWLSSPATSEILFSTPTEQRWRAAAQVLGVDMAFLSMNAGHA
jgi:putative transcriptional regulator